MLVGNKYLAFIIHTIYDVRFNVRCLSRARMTFVDFYEPNIADMPFVLHRRSMKSFIREYLMTFAIFGEYFQTSSNLFMT